MDPVVHFEMPMSNESRVSEFYTKAFGWEMKPMGEQYGNYLMAMTAESDTEGPKARGRINGGFYVPSDSTDNRHPSLVISVDDLDQALQRVRDAGGTVLNEPVEIPNVGLFASFTDTEGNRLSLLQPTAMGKQS